MPVPVPCPNCGKKLRIPEEMLGRRVKCPACTKGFTAVHPAAPPPPSADDNPFGAMGENSHFSFDEHAEVAKTPIPGVRGSWKVVRFGLRCISLSMFCYLAILISSGILFALAMEQQLLKELLRATHGYAGIGFAGCQGLLALISVIASFIGMALCIAAPSEGGSKLLAILALLAVVLSLVATCGLIVPLLNLVVALIVPTAAFIGNLLFVLFLRSCAFSLQNPGLGRSFMWLLVFQILVGVVVIGTIVMLIVIAIYFPAFDFTPRQRQEMGEGIVIAAMIVIASAVFTGLFSIVLYLISVMRLSACIDRMMPRIAEA